MARIPAPSTPMSIDRLRRAARDLKTAYRAGDRGAVQRVRVQRVRDGSDDLRHADFLHVIAREHGFASWPRLKLAAETQGLDRAARQQRLRLALAHGQGWVAEALLAEDAELARGALDLEVALYDLEAVRAALAEDPGRAVAEVNGRVPMVHLAFSRWFRAQPGRVAQMIAVAEALLAHGADVNVGMPAYPGSDHVLSPLYGAIGHGDNMVLGRWLLEHGADPDDGESLYHATELGHHEGLRMLLDHGADPRGTNALLRAMDFNDHAAVGMLLDHGARVDDVDPSPGGGDAPQVVPALHHAARRAVDARMVALLMAAGADPRRFYQGASAYGFARVFGHADLARAIEERGGATPLSPAEALLAAAAEGRDTGDARLDADDLPPAYATLVRTILHLPGRLGHVRRLVALGLPWDAPDAEGLTPVQVAGWEGLPEVMGYFLSLGPDLDHVNGYGGTLLTTILHGAENNPDVGRDRDYPECLRLALARGVPLPRAAIGFSGRADLAEVLAEWAAAHPEKVS